MELRFPIQNSVQHYPYWNEVSYITFEARLRITKRKTELCFPIHTNKKVKFDNIHLRITKS